MKVESVGMSGEQLQPRPSTVERARDSSFKASAEPEKLEKLVSSSEVLDKIKALSEDGRYSVRFEKDKDGGDLVIKVVDAESGETIRQFPPEEVLDAAKKIEEFRGLVLNTQV